MNTQEHISQENTAKKQRPSRVLEIQDLRKSFGDNTVLNGFSMDLYQGENVVVMGRSGSGKSVMIKCVVGLMQPDSGNIKILGNELTQLDRKDLDKLRAEIGFLFQGSALYDSMTVRENLEFPLRRHLSRFGADMDAEALIVEALDSVNLAHTLDLLPNELSGGMQRRVALARALILKPRIMLYDEPTSGLDPITAKEIIKLMQAVQEKYQTSSLIITHDVDCARVISNRMILLVDGINYAEGTFAELSRSKDPKVQAFFK